MKAKFGIFGAVLMIASALLAAAPAAACHSQTVSCDDASWSDNNMSPNTVTITPSARTVWPGASTEYHIQMTLSPGCGGTFYLYSLLGSVPPGWSATYTDGPGKTGQSLANIDNVQWGNGNVVVHAYLNVTSPIGGQEGATAEIIAMLGADDNARNDKDLVNVKTTTKIHIPDPPPVVQTPLVDFNMAEDTVDTHITLATTFRDTDNDPMQYTNKQSANFTIATMADGKVTITPKKDWNGQEILIFTATDGYTQVSDHVAVTVTPVQDVPILAAPMKDFTVMEDGEDTVTVNLAKVFFDADVVYGDKLTFTNTGNVNITVTIKVDGKVSFKPAAGWAGQETVAFKAEDTAAASVTDDVKITITDSSRPPYVKSPLPDISLPEDTVDSTSIDLGQIFADPDAGTAFTYEANKNQFVNVSITGGKVTFAPMKDWNGVETIEFSASDGMFCPVFDDIRVTVTPVNDLPYNKKQVPVTFDEDTPSTPVWLDNSFADVDGDKLTYSASSTDELTITISSRTSEMSMTSKLNYNGQQKVPLTVSDGKDSIKYDIQVTVNASDDSPAITEWMPGGNAVCTEGDEISFSVKAMDIDGDVLGYNWEVDQNFSPLKAFVGKDAMKIKATKDSAFGPGKHILTVWADGAEKSSVSHSWEVTVRIGNRAPSVPTIRTPLPTQNYTTTTPVTFDAVAEDLDQDPVTYKWFVDGTEASSAQSFSSKLTQGTHKVKVVASDGKGGSTESLEIGILVKKPVTPPNNNNQPGFEGVFLLAAMGAALVLLRKRK